MLDTIGGLSWNAVFIIIIGLVLFISGISNFSEYFHLKRPGTIYDGTVDSSQHKERRDRKGNLVQYYWELQIRYHKGNQIVPAKIRSNVQYEKGDKLKIVERNRTPVILDDRHSSVWSGIFLAAAGVVVILASVLSEKVSARLASWLVSVIFVLIAGALLAAYRNENVNGMTPIKGTIDKLILFQSDQEARQLISPKHWYPLITYEWEGERREFLSKINSNYKASFKVGAEVTLYYDPSTGNIVERKPSKVLLIAAVALFILAIVSAIITAIGG